MLQAKSEWQVMNPNAELVQQFVDKLKIPELIAALLINRGIVNLNEAKQFLNVHKQNFHDPFQFSQMATAVERIKNAIAKGERIAIFGDYDADGVTSTAILLRTFQLLTAMPSAVNLPEDASGKALIEPMGSASTISYYIPNRFSEGYGPNISAIEKLHHQGVTLLITVDTGVAAIEEMNKAATLGMDVVITDHHQMGAELPNAYSILHPKLDDNYPYQELCGAGVALKLSHALLGEALPDCVTLAAIGTIADLVELHGENRLIVTKGLECMKTSQLPAIQALAQIAGIPLDTINEETIAFGFAPRLNAAGRLGSADKAVELLMSDSLEKAVEIATDLDAINRQRQELVLTITEEAIAMVEETFPISQWPIIVIGKSGWNSGVVGIVASKLVERYAHPAIVISLDEAKNEAKGSARSVEGYNLYQQLLEQEKLLSRFGGHPMAAGLSLRMENLDAFREAINHEAKINVDPAIFVSKIAIDCKVKLADITVKTIQLLDRLAPFGRGNPRPRILVEKVEMLSSKKVGADFNHFKAQLTDDTGVIDLIGFGQGHIVEQISQSDQLSIVGGISINEWNNKLIPQMTLQDISCNHVQIFDWRSLPLTEFNLNLIPIERRIVVFNEESIQQLPPSIHSEVEVYRGTFSTGKIAENLCLVDFPNSKQLIQEMFAQAKYSRYYLFLKKRKDELFVNPPTRDQFKWMYAFLTQNHSFNAQAHAENLAKRNLWKKDSISFILKVFFELGFVTIDNGIVNLVKGVAKKDLVESTSYSSQLAKSELENQLLFSSKKDFTNFFRSLMNATES